jgi:endonuclease YncB( thermonuclease family)
MGMKLHYAVLFGTMLLLPVGIKLGVPALLMKGEQMGLLQVFTKTQASSPYTVEEIAFKSNLRLTVRTPEKSVIKVRLIGLQAANEQWQSQAAGEIALLLKASNAQVFLLNVQPIKPGAISAIIALPNGTLLQEILLADGLAKLDPAQLPHLSQQTTQGLQQAQAKAKAQRKNVWGENHTRFVTQP